MSVRVVYDGPAGAGKTTNVRQLAAAFATQRWGELDSPEELAGRTLWFDWLQIRAGVVCGFPLICQIVTVPGQVALTPRRRELLASADVVVFVCESEAEGLERSRRALRLVEDLRSVGRAPPIRLLQANKQDRAEAMDPRLVAEALGCGDETILGAIASEGVGVVDTFVAAVRALSRSLDGRMRSEGLRVAARRAEGASAVLDRLAATAIDPEDAAEMLLEELAALHLGNDATSTAAPVEATPPGARATVRPASSVASATLPTSAVPPGFIWPAHTGRTTLDALAKGGALEGEAQPDASGEIRRIVDHHVLFTSVHHRFESSDAARQALVHAARERTQLERLLVAGTVLTVQESRSGASWLWRVAPRLEPWTERWCAASSARGSQGGEGAASGEGSRSGLLVLLASALVDGALLALRRGLTLEPGLGSYGLQGGVVRYAGEIFRCDAGELAATTLLAAAADAAGALGAPRAELTAAIEEELGRRLGSDGAARTMTRVLAVQAA